MGELLSVLLYSLLNLLSVLFIVKAQVQAIIFFRESKVCSHLSKKWEKGDRRRGRRERDKGKSESVQ